MLERKLYLIRHSKSDWTAPYNSDWERGLSKRGKKNAFSLAKMIQKRQIVIQRGLISDSKRTKQTFAILKKESEFVQEEFFINSLYEAKKEDLKSLLISIPNNIESAMILGHNPGLEDLINSLIYPGKSGSLFYKFPTSSMVILKRESASWKEFVEKIPGLQFFWIPEKT